MVVKPQSNGHRFTGIYIGVNNVRRYFPRRIAAIDLQIDHLRIRCGLAPGFWHGDPEIRDSRLSDWLELKQLQGAGNRSSMPLAMTRSGEDCFILGPAAPNEHARAPRTHSPSPVGAGKAVGPFAVPALSN
jgi:hypothetical protein